MSNSVLFDPNELNTEQTTFLQTKLEKASSSPDRDGCRTFLPKSRVSGGKYGRLRTRPDIGELFGDKNRGYNASKLLYCLYNGVVWLDTMDVECSHLCGYKLCMEITHIAFEPHDINTNRTEHHSSFDCNGNHGSYDDCIIKSYIP